MTKDDMTEYQEKRLEFFKTYMEKCFGIRWASICEYGKIRLMKQCFYAGYDAFTADKI